MIESRQGRGASTAGYSAGESTGGAAQSAPLDPAATGGAAQPAASDPAPPRLLGRIGQIAIATNELETLKRFYGEALGLPLLFEVPGRMAFFDCDGIRLMLSLPEPEEFDHPPSTLYFSVADIEAAHRELTARGVRFVEAPHFVADLGTHELWLAFFRDPERATHALMAERPK